MAAELPYFRFTVSEWMNGDISMEDYACKGLFIDICAWYWFKDCSVTKAMLEKKFNKPHALQLLYDSEIIKSEDDDIIIEFLNAQFDILSEKRKLRQAAGSKGGKQKSSNAKAKLKQKPSYKANNKDKEKDNNKDNIIGFTPPEFEEVIKYCKERGRGVNAKKWFNHYKANGWKVGANKMVDWKASVEGWEEGNVESKGSNLGGTKIPEDYGKPSENAVTREEYLKSKEEKL